MNFTYRLIFTLALSGLMLLAGLRQTKAQNSTDSLTFSLFLIGDTGAPTLPGARENLEKLRGQLLQSGKHSAVVYLGDNIYPYGLPDENDPLYEIESQKITLQLDLLEGYAGQIYFIPGNHDWRQGKENGLNRVRNQERLVESYLENEEAFIPNDGCPGPIVKYLSENIVLIVVDTQYFLHKNTVPTKEDGCEYTDLDEVLTQVQDILERNQDKKVVLATHHPFFSAGPHGGHTTWKQHIFPLTDLDDNLYIPLPLIGSIYPLYRSLLGDIQDMPNPRYSQVRNAFVSLLNSYPNTIHAAGHEHMLQYYLEDSVHYIVSGSGAKTATVMREGGKFLANQNGFARLDFFGNGDVKLEFHSINNEKAIYDEIIFNKAIDTSAAADLSEGSRNLDYSDSTVIVAASGQYAANSFRKWLMGDNYRKEWQQPVKVPVFDISKEKGGLEIVKRGGGQQTKSLRLEADDEKQYVLRSIEKYPENAIPAPLRKTFAADIVQDQISASHPYGAIVLPPLADAAGVLHTNPSVVFLPDDPLLGPYRKDFANTLVLYEERPDEDWSDQASFGYSEELLSTRSVIEDLKDDSDNYVVQDEVLRARLFDMIIGDWDRHDDQWRWAEYDNDGKGKHYIPVPRDRDQVFFVNEGFIPKLASRKWAMPKIEGFDYEMRYPPGFMYNARYFDRTFLNQLEKEDWVAISDTLQRRLTDESIEQAIKSWPKEIYELSGEEIVAKLKSRRDNLKGNALEHYSFLAKGVDIPGSDKHEHYMVDRLDDDRTRVRIYKRKKDEGTTDKLLYDRTFFTDETDEIRLFGLEGEDRFDIKGDAKDGILIRVIGGADTDTVIVDSNVRGWVRKTKVYDTNEDNYIVKNSDTKDRTSDRLDVNAYDRKAFRYDQLIPLVSIEYNPDDGIFLGGGAMYTKHGFRREPYASRNKFTTNYALNTGSFNIRYKGEFNQTVASLDLVARANIRAPRFVNNFFGLGNEAVNEEDANGINYYRVRYEWWDIGVELRKRFGFSEISAGPMYEGIELENTGGRFIAEMAENDELEPSLFSNRNYGGISGHYELDLRDDEIIPKRGIYFNIEGRAMTGINDLSNDYGVLQGDLRFYNTFRKPFPFTFATRFGGGVTLGDFPFFQAQKLGGTENLRGYRMTRFYGGSMAYNNTEVRIHLLNFQTYLFPGQLGILAFHDVGRVWFDGESSDKWHTGYGGGIFVSPIGQVVISAMIGASEEDVLPLVKFGFQF
ncbi:BamA/TamA family outer membrane protein [Roseivirga sp. BDSF3-8]|uniref:BamA/TamA family outer membrane protein n=1 Tax=Roseivirga sp. BDSF3-8 TaxID=3241598 RepID=UPI003531B6B3